MSTRVTLDHWLLNDHMSVTSHLSLFQVTMTTMQLQQPLSLQRKSDGGPYGLLYHRLCCITGVLQRLH